MATVITSLATTIPVVGKTILYWLWGGFSVDHPTLNRFYSLHYTLPFVLAGLSIFHIAALHQYGSTNPLGIHTAGSTIPFGTYFSSKDLLGVLVLFFVFATLIFFYPEYLGHKAVHIRKNIYYYSAICWKHLLMYTTHIFINIVTMYTKINLAFDSFLTYHKGLLHWLEPVGSVGGSSGIIYMGQSAGNLLLINPLYLIPKARG